MKRRSHSDGTPLDVVYDDSSILAVTKPEPCDPPRRGVLPTTTNDRKVTMLRAYRLMHHLEPGKRAMASVGSRMWRCEDKK